MHDKIIIRVDDLHTDCILSPIVFQYEKSETLTTQAQNLP